ncbi:tetratricopeptide repeat protein [bacterium]|nr:tetratricopeptide repeat protein [bacterium]
MIALKINATYDESLFLEGMMPQSISVFGPVEGDINQGKYSSAMMKLTTLSNTYSKDLHFLGLLAQTQKALSDYTGLIKTLNTTAKIAKTPASYLDLMYCYYTQGRLNEALDVALSLQEMGLKGIQEKSLVHCLIRIYLEFSDYEGIEETVKSYKGTHKDGLIIWAMGLVRLANGNKNDALRLFRSAVEINPANDQAWVSLAMLHEEMGDRELALANLERALDKNSKNATGLKLMAKWHRRDLEQSQKMMSRVQYYLSQHEFDEEISLCYVQLLKENNAVDTARFELDKLILTYPNKSEYGAMKNNLEQAAKV